MASSLYFMTLTFLKNQVVCSVRSSVMIRQDTILAEMPLQHPLSQRIISEDTATNLPFHSHIICVSTQFLCTMPPFAVIIAPTEECFESNCPN